MLCISALQGFGMIMTWVFATVVIAVINKKYN
jgi:hypothetical protein